MAAFVLLLLAASTQAFITSPNTYAISEQRNYLGFIVHPNHACNHMTSHDRRHQNSRPTCPVILKSSKSDTEIGVEINKMRVKEIRDELESYGISTKSFFEKSEMVDALLAARKEGKTPIKDVVSSGEGSTSSSSSSSNDTNVSSNTTGNRQERLQKELEKCRSLKVSDLKAELESYGMSTKSYFEKGEFVRAVAEARVDGVTTKSVGTSSAGQRQKEEPIDPSFRDVAVSKFSGESKMAMGGAVIDVKAR